MTAPQLLLVAALRLEAGTTLPWGLEDLTVEAYRLSPARFGLPGYRGAYPDNKRVAVEVYKRGRYTFARYLLPRKIDGRRTVYRLTAAGVAEAGRLAGRLAAEAVA